jgi:hypothetical protein
MRSAVSAHCPAASFRQEVDLPAPGEQPELVFLLGCKSQIRTDKLVVAQFSNILEYALHLFSLWSEPNHAAVRYYDLIKFEPTKCAIANITC